MLRITFEKLNEILSDTSKWERNGMVLNTSTSDYCYKVGFQKKDGLIYFGQVGWCGDELDDFAFSMSDIYSVPENEYNKICDQIKKELPQYIEEDEEKEIYENGFFADEYCGWDCFFN